MPQPVGVRTPLSADWYSRPANPFERAFSMLASIPSATASPRGEPELKTRDFAVVEEWLIAGHELAFHGIGSR